ncbi:phosphoribosyl 1,2-cyclic phosphodiesterase [Chromatiales bacterium (ex Bugula neritina AB1)]|nr:phosphoribosyl 1,2-cyclic phosphodiesterase [Chromatiales bacterium (ex Bugula neritina AB1)]
MTTETTFTLLGTGSSGGVPRIGNDWGACDPENPKNRRRRCAMLVEKCEGKERTSILIDTGPDMREQLLTANVQHLDAVLLTHAHADHIFGMDDLRQLAIRHRQRVNVYMDAATSETVMRAFGYCYQQAPGTSYPSICLEHRITAPEDFNISGDGGAIGVRPFEVNHGDINALGFRFGDIAYLPDVKTVERADSINALTGLEVLILDALRQSPHPTHMNVEEALAFIEQVKPRRAILTNMHSSIDYAAITKELPAGVEAAYDGLTVVDNS